MGGVPRKKKKVAQNLLKHALVLEFLKSEKKNSRWGGGGQKKKLFRMCWNMLSFWNFWNPAKFFEKVYRQKKVNRQTDRHHSENIYDAPLEKRSRLKIRTLSWIPSGAIYQQLLRSHQTHLLLIQPYNAAHTVTRSQLFLLKCWTMKQMRTQSYNML